MVEDPDQSQQAEAAQEPEPEVAVGPEADARSAVAAQAADGAPVEQAEPAQAAPSEGQPPSQDDLEAMRAEEDPISWQASEFVHHHKGMAWYSGLVAVVAVLVGISALLHQWLTIALFAVMATAVLVYARKPPRVMSYELTPTSVSIDGKEFMYKEFKSFGVHKDVEWHTIDLEPSKRWSPRMTLLFDDQDLAAIVGHLELHLPRVERKPDVIDRVSRYLRF